MSARNWDLNKATQLLFDYLQWKRSFGCPVDPRTCMTELLKGKTFVHGTDRVGNPVIYHFVRKQDPSTRDLQEAVRAVVFWAEQAEKSATATGKVTVCFVRAGATNANSDLGLAKAIMRILANNFPERLDRVLVYPTGIGYRAAWATFQWLLDPTTRKKIQPVSDQYELIQYIAPEQLLAEFGGHNQFQFSAAAIPGLNWWDLETVEKEQREKQQRKDAEEQQRQMQQMQQHPVVGRNFNVPRQPQGQPQGQPQWGAPPQQQPQQQQQRWGAPQGQQGGAPPQPGWQQQGPPQGGPPRGPYGGPPPPQQQQQQGGWQQPPQQQQWQR